MTSLYFHSYNSTNTNNNNNNNNNNNRNSNNGRNIIASNSNSNSNKNNKNQQQQQSELATTSTATKTIQNHRSQQQQQQQQSNNMNQRHYETTNVTTTFNSAGVAPLQQQQQSSTGSMLASRQTSATTNSCCRKHQKDHQQQQQQQQQLQANSRTVLRPILHPSSSSTRMPSSGTGMRNSSHKIKEILGSTTSTSASSAINNNDSSSPPAPSRHLLHQNIPPPVPPPLNNANYSMTHLNDDLNKFTFSEPTESNEPLQIVNGYSQNSSKSRQHHSNNNNNNNNHRNINSNNSTTTRQQHSGILGGSYNQQYSVVSTTPQTRMLDPSSSASLSSSSSKFLSVDKGVVGLKNLGNTCFMNSILQCLNNTKCLSEYCLNSDEHANDLNTTLSVMKGSLFRAYAQLVKHMWTKSDQAVSPHDFKSQIARFAPRFVGYAQQDAEEFMYYLLKGLHEDVNLIKKKPSAFKFDEKAWDRMNDVAKSREHWEMNLRTDNSRISDMFVGQLKSTLQCTKCAWRSPTFELFWHLALPIPHRSIKQVKLDDCLRLFMTEEILDIDNKPMCAACKKEQRCTKCYTIEHLPKILVIHLKRFSKTRFNNKINVNIEYPIENLDMSQYLSSSSSSSSGTIGGSLYDLYGVALHSGTELSGHYVAYCKHPVNQKWHLFNDSQVREVSHSSVQDPNAYILFYKKKGF